MKKEQKSPEDMTWLEFLKYGWKKCSYFVKGICIGFLFSSLIYVSFMIVMVFGSGFHYATFDSPIKSNFISFVSSYFMVYISLYLVFIILPTIVVFGLIGLVIDKIKKKK